MRHSIEDLPEVLVESDIFEDLDEARLFVLYLEADD
jgi:hypothetical protein